MSNTSLPELFLLLCHCRMNQYRIYLSGSLSSGTGLHQQPMIYLKTSIDNITSVLLQADVSIIVHPSESQGSDSMDEQ